MDVPSSSFDELGPKVQRAQQQIGRIRGVATVDGVRVEVDAHNRLVSISVPNSAAVLAAYRAAVRDKQPQVDAAMRDVLDDPRAQAVSQFVEANKTPETGSSDRAAVADDRYFERIQQDPLGRNR